MIYSPPLESHIRALRPIQSNSNWEIEIRGVSIWCVELIKREIEKRHPEVKSQQWQATPEQQQQQEEKKQQEEQVSNSAAATEAIEDEKKCTTQKHARQMSVHEPNFSGINAILIDFFLYDTIKSLEAAGTVTIPHHRTRSIWY